MIVLVVKQPKERTQQVKNYWVYGSKEKHEIHPFFDDSNTFFSFFSLCFYNLVFFFVIFGRMIMLLDVFCRFYHVFSDDDGKIFGWFVFFLELLSKFLLFSCIYFFFLPLFPHLFHDLSTVW